MQVLMGTRYSWTAALPSRLWLGGPPNRLVAPRRCKRSLREAPKPGSGGEWCLVWLGTILSLWANPLWTSQHLKSSPWFPYGFSVLYVSHMVSYGFTWFPMVFSHGFLKNIKYYQYILPSLWEWILWGVKSWQRTVVPKATSPWPNDGSPSSTTPAAPVGLLECGTSSWHQLELCITVTNTGCHASSRWNAFKYNMAKLWFDYS